MSPGDDGLCAGGSEGYQGGSERYQGGSRRYQSGSERYQSAEEGPSARAPDGGPDPKRDAEEDVRHFLADRSDLHELWLKWANSHFPEMGDSMVRMELQNEGKIPDFLVHQLPVPRRFWAEGENPLPAGDPPTRPPPRSASRQVGIRLSLRSHERLEVAAGSYGVAPGTLARMLVNRGVDAILAGESR